MWRRGALGRGPVVNEKFNLAKDGKDPVIKWLELKKKGVIPEREKYEGVEDKVGEHHWLLCQND